MPSSGMPAVKTAGSASGAPSPYTLAGPPDWLSLLKELAFILDRRGDDELGLLELAQRARPADSHGGAQGADQVLGAIVDASRAQQDLTERPALADVDSGAARQVGIGGGHPPVIAATGRVGRAGQDRADHHRVGAGGEGLGVVAAHAHSAIRDDLDPPTGLSKG